jgi:hypothetical protein
MIPSLIYSLVQLVERHQVPFRAACSPHRSHRSDRSSEIRSGRPSPQIRAPMVPFPSGKASSQTVTGVLKRSPCFSSGRFSGAGVPFPRLLL